MTVSKPLPGIRAISLCALGMERAEAGITREHGYNRGPEVEFFQRVAGGDLGESWCADFQFAKLVKAYCVLSGLLIGKSDAQNQAIILAREDEFSRLYHVPRTGSCQAVADAARVQGRFRPKGFKASPGDLVTWDFPVKGKRLGRAHHIGMVIRAGDETVEGNTSSGAAGSQSDGDGVFERSRDPEFVYGYVHW